MHPSRGNPSDGGHTRVKDTRQICEGSQLNLSWLSTTSKLSFSSWSRCSIRMINPSAPWGWFFSVLPYASFCMKKRNFHIQFVLGRGFDWESQHLMPDHPWRNTILQSVSNTINGWPSAVQQGWASAWVGQKQNRWIQSALEWAAEYQAFSADLFHSVMCNKPRTFSLNGMHHARISPAEAITSCCVT